MTTDGWTPTDEDVETHVCAECAECIHNGNRCCGCYDGACCQSAPVGH